MDKLLEVCVDSLASARAAVAGGADRLELCSALSIGGLTPSAALLEQVRRESSIPIRCLMRPRAGDFLYAPEEIAQMAMEIRQLRAAGADGFVIGCLTPQGALDRSAMAPLVEAAGGCALTLHRCVDVSRDPVRTCLEAAELGIDTVLTSGAAPSCLQGADMLERLLCTPGVPTIMAGAGISAAAIQALRQRLPGLTHFHMSGKTNVASKMAFRREGIPMGVPGFDEWHIQQTGQDNVRAARLALYKEDTL